jgi:hypothetical protein
MADLALTATQISPVNETQAVVRYGKAAVALTAGDAVYFNSSGKLALARANAVGTSQLEGVVLSQPGAGANQTCEYIMQGSVYGFTLTGMAYGATAYLSSAVAGKLADTKTTGTGNFVVEAGRVIPMSDNDLTKVLYVNCAQQRSLVALP